MGVAYHYAFKNQQLRGVLYVQRQGLWRDQDGVCVCGFFFFLEKPLTALVTWHSLNMEANNMVNVAGTLLT